MAKGTAFVGALLLSTFLYSSCKAQTYSDPIGVQPDLRDFVTPSGVSLASQTFALNRTDLSIGRAEDGSMLQLDRRWSSERMIEASGQLSTRWGVDNRTVGVSNGYIVFSNGIERYAFRKVKDDNSPGDSSLYVSTEYNGSHLSQGYDYSYSKHPSFVLHLQNGNKLYFSPTFNPGDAQDFCSKQTYGCGRLIRSVAPGGTTTYYIRNSLGDVVLMYNSFGYGISLAYNTRRNVTSAVAVNVASAGCSISTGICSNLTGWPKTSYTYELVNGDVDGAKTEILKRVDAANGEYETYEYSSYTESDTCMLSMTPSPTSPRILWAIKSVYQGGNATAIVTNTYAKGCFPATSTVTSQTLGNGSVLNFSRDYSFSGGGYEYNFILSVKRDDVLWLSAAVKRLSGSDSNDLTRRIISITDGKSRKTLYEYNNHILLNKITYPSGSSTSYAYDANYNLTQKTISSATTKDIVVSNTYSDQCVSVIGCNRITSMTDGRGFKTDYTYNSVHGAIETKESPATSPNGKVYTKLEYSSNTDANGALFYLPTKVTTKDLLSGALASDVRTTYKEKDGNFAPKSKSSYDGSVYRRTCLIYSSVGDLIAQTKPNAMCAE